MSTVVSFLVLAFVLLAPFGLVAAFARSAHGQGSPWFHRDQFRFAAPLAGPSESGRWLPASGLRRSFGGRLLALVMAARGPGLFHVTRPWKTPVLPGIHPSASAPPAAFAAKTGLPRSNSHLCLLSE